MDAPVVAPRATGTGFDAALRRGGNTGSLVGMRRTQLSGSQAAEALSRAWEGKRGAPPSRATLSILTAQWALETGRGASMYNYNFAGLKGQGPTGLSFESRTTEGSGATAHRITDRFRAYGTATEGASDYLALLEKRYGPALDAAQNGDSSGFVRQLKARGYFTGNEADYTRGIDSLSKLAMGEGFDALTVGPVGQAVAVGASEVKDTSAPPTSMPVGEEALLARFSEAWSRFSAGDPAPSVEPWRLAEAISRSALSIGTDDERNT